jgi:hypothetical protein
MWLLSLLSGLWPLIKELLYGDKIKNEVINKRDTENNKFNIVIVIDMFQKSRKFATLVVLLLIFSLFINYKTITKLVDTIPVVIRENKSEELSVLPDAPTREGETVIPKASLHLELEIARENTLTKLQNTYKKY